LNGLMQMVMELLKKDDECPTEAGLAKFNGWYR
jgi:hypothetical protein